MSTGKQLSETFCWTLPEGMESPPLRTVARLEKLRRRLLDLYISWGYLQTSPPFVEFADWLHEIQGPDLSLFELSDSMSERRLALRGDATAQVACVRSAQMADVPDPVRLCYCLPAAHRRAESLGAPRFFYQVGAELFGATDRAAETEILSLMVQTVQQAGLDDIIVSLGHTAFFSSLMQASDIRGALRLELLSLLQKRAIPEIMELASRAGIASDTLELLRQLAGAHGEMEHLEELTAPFLHLEGIPEAVAQLHSLSEELASGCRTVFDLSDVNSRLYHQGPVFACFTPVHGAAVARGGRYKAQNNSRAVGFTANLWLLSALGDQTEPSGQRIFAPATRNQTLEKTMEKLRQSGEIVVRGFCGQSESEASAMGCTHILQEKNGRWTVETLQPESPS